MTVYDLAPHFVRTSVNMILQGPCFTLFKFIDFIEEGWYYGCFITVPPFLSVHPDKWWQAVSSLLPTWEACTMGRFNTLRPRQNGRHLTDVPFQCIFLYEDGRILIKTSLKFVPKGPINNIPPLVQKMAWCRPADKPLSETMMVSSLRHICITQPQWV